MLDEQETIFSARKTPDGYQLCQDKEEANWSLETNGISLNDEAVGPWLPVMDVLPELKPGEVPGGEPMIEWFEDRVIRTFTSREGDFELPDRVAELEKKLEKVLAQLDAQ